MSSTVELTLECRWPDRELLAARAMVRTLRACGDDEEKQVRFLATMLRDIAEREVWR